MKVTFEPTEKPIKAVGFSHQEIGTLSVTNDTDEELVLKADTWQELATMFGVDIFAGENMEVRKEDLTLVFLFKGVRNSQFYLTSKEGRINPGDTALIVLKVIEEPGDPGTFNIQVGDSTSKITVE